MINFHVQKEACFELSESVLSYTNMSSKLIMKFPHLPYKRCGHVSWSHGNWFLSCLTFPRSALEIIQEHHGAQQPNTLGKPGSVYGQECCFAQELPEQTARRQSWQAFSFPCWLNADHYEDRLQPSGCEGHCTARQRERPAFHTLSPKEEPLGKGSLCAMLCSRKIPSFCGNLAFGSEHRM